MRWTEDDRYLYAVLDVAMDLHGEACGSGANNCTREELESISSWLRWRITDGWMDPCGDKWARVEESVRTIARLALEEWDEWERQLAESRKRLANA